MFYRILFLTGITLILCFAFGISSDYFAKIDLEYRTLGNKQGFNGAKIDTPGTSRSPSYSQLSKESIQKKIAELTPAHEVNVKLNDAIELLGYDIEVGDSKLRSGIQSCVRVKNIRLSITGNV